MSFLPLHFINPLESKCRRVDLTRARRCTINLAFSMSVRDSVTWCCKWQKWKRERRRNDRRKCCFGLIKDKKLSPQQQFLKLFPQRFFSTIQITTKALHRFVYGTSKGWYKWSWEMHSIKPFYQGYTAKQLISSCPSLKHSLSLDISPSWASPPALPKTSLAPLPNTWLQQILVQILDLICRSSIKRHKAYTWKI